MKLKPGDKAKLTEDDFTRLYNAFFTEVENDVPKPGPEYCKAMVQEK